MRDVVENGAAGGSESELLVENVCWVFEEELRREAVLEVCENEKGVPGGVDSLP